MKTRRASRGALLFGLAVVAMLAPADHLPSSVQFLARTRGSLDAAALLVLYSAGIALTFILFCARSAVVRVLAYNVAIASLITSAASRALNSAGFGIEEARIALHESALADQALISFVHVWLPPALVALVVGCAGFTVGNRLFPRVVNTRTAVTASLASIAAALLPVAEAYVSFLPGSVRLPLVLAAAAGGTPYSVLAWDRRSLKPAQATAPKHVVVIVDESIRSDVANGRHPQAIDFRSAVAATNCSASTNFVLRNGVRPKELPDVSGATRARPNIFEHARRSGRRTVLLDAQSATAAPRNLMSAAELSRIDEQIIVARLFPDTPRHELDRRGLDLLAGLLQSKVPSFIWFNKYGAHFHYENAYPQRASVHKPHLAPGEPFRDRNRTINSYRNAARWSSELFLRELGSLATVADAVIVYTADHGQSFEHEGSTYPHCVTTAPPASQGRVPLTLFGPSSSTYLAAIRSAAARPNARASHFQLFPTLLVLLGGERARVIQAHGPDLAEPTDESRFYSGDLFGRGLWGWTDAR